jgi:hypothetical protein
LLRTILLPRRAYFMHVNGRHHSLALIKTGKASLHHLMMECLSLDDMGEGYDVALSEEGRIGTTLGAMPMIGWRAFMSSCRGAFWSNTAGVGGIWTPPIGGRNAWVAYGYMIAIGPGRTLSPKGGRCAWRPLRAVKGHQCRCCPAE